ncbi:hypothetical protein [Flavisphingomonas formosensis]|uniref:hypothetical protein n=1 Tax=Flavisphingomonas formosensis TaxID=861534 RepID=UPI0012FBBD6E|nr:hypothetical protein [Sphingomonas formosensis]
MITVSATDLLRVIDATLVSKVEPSLGDVNGRSALATVRHLLNFVRVRIEREGAMLIADDAALRRLLGQMAEYHRSAGDSEAAAVVTAALETAPTCDATASLDDLTLEARALREALHLALARLQGLRAERGDDPAYQAIRAQIRAHIVREIEAEGELVGPAFFGRGPRR